MADFNIKQHDTWPPIEITLLDAAGDPVDLGTALSARIILKTKGGTPTVIVDEEVSMGGGGIVSYQFTALDTADVNTLDGEIEVTWGDNTITTFPTNGYFSVQISADLA